MPSNTLNIATCLQNNALQFPDKKAIIYPIGTHKDGSVKYGHKTYNELNTESDQYARGFESAGIKKGTKTLFMVKPGPDLFSITFGLFKVGAIPVIVDPGLGVKRMLHCFNAVNAEAFIGIKRAHIFRLLMARHFKSVKTWITVGKRLFWGGYSLKKIAKQKTDAYPIADTDKHGLALINFTTGSTGPAKGVEYTHAMINKEYQSLKLNYYDDPDHVDLATLSLFALYDILIGITAVLPKIDATKPALVDPRNIIDPILHYKATMMFASPALLNRVGKYGIEHGIKLPTMRTVLAGGAPVTLSTMEVFQQLLNDEGSILTTYGSTEALPISSIDFKTLEANCRHKTESGMGTCIGKPLESVEVSIIKITDEPIENWNDNLLSAKGTVGEIVLKGGIVSQSYYKNPNANALNKIQDGNENRHRMGDLGLIDEEGQLWFCGRKQHRVCTSESTLFSVQCEGIFNQHPDVFRSALVGVGPKSHQTPIICIELEPSKREILYHSKTSSEALTVLRNSILDIGKAHAITHGITTVLFHDAFPVDIRHNAKIGREELAIWALQQGQKS
jgi:acyl-CoA synthetase (AMP-forming)/AMP-acid ligase II